MEQAKGHKGWRRSGAVVFGTLGECGNRIGSIQGGLSAWVSGQKGKSVQSKRRKIPRESLAQFSAFGWRFWNTHIEAILKSGAVCQT
jgi:hypothetical protein